MISLLGLALVHLAGSAIVTLVVRRPLKVSLQSPSSAWVALAALYACALGPAGAGILLVLAGAAVLTRRQLTATPLRFPWAPVAFIAVLVLARPWVPTQWDEFVWLAKARFETLGYGAGITAALDPAQHVIPAGYPPLWPSAVGWLALGRDSLEAQVLAASLLVLLSFATAIEALQPHFATVRLEKWWAVVVFAVPFAWVHARSTYVDLPLGLLGVALLGRLLAPRVGLEAVVLAVVLAGLKDEGLALVVGATLGVLFSARNRERFVPLLAAIVTTATWRLMVSGANIVVFDHALGWPYWPWLPRFAQLLWLHATDVFSWGVFWAVVFTAAARGKSALARPFFVMLATNLGIMALVLIAGPERVRVFAENGTLLNRLLVQLWPVATAGLVLSASKTAREHL